MLPLDVLCPTCGAAGGDPCAGRSAPHVYRVISASDRRFVTDQGQRLHRLALADTAAGTRRGRCGATYANTYEVPRGSSLLARLVDCGTCARALGSVQ